MASLCLFSSLTTTTRGRFSFSHKHTTSTTPILFHSKTNQKLCSLSHSLSSLRITSQFFTSSIKPTTSSIPSFVSNFSKTESSLAEAESQVESQSTLSETTTTQVVESPDEKPKREEVFAVVMVGSRQYIVFPGRYIYTQRLKGANVNDKVILNKVLLVGTRNSAYIGQPIVPNAAVHAVVEEQTLDKKVIVFKYKKKKNYRRNIGHRQPITRIRIMGITGYQDSPAITMD